MSLHKINLLIFFIIISCHKDKKFISEFEKKEVFAEFFVASDLSIKLPLVVAIVDKKEIKAERVYEEYKKILGSEPEIPPFSEKNLIYSIVERLVENELIDFAIKKEKPTITEDEFNKYYESYKSNFKNEDHFKSYLKYHKLDENALKDKLKVRYAMEKIIIKNEPIKVSDEEIEDYYKNNVRFYTKGQRVHFKQIFIRLRSDATEEEKNQVEKKVKEIGDLLQKEAFEEIAEKFNDDYTSKLQGDRGIVELDALESELSETLQSMKKGEIRGPIRTKYGIYFLKLIEIYPQKTYTIEEVKDEIKQLLTRKKILNLQDQYLQKLKMKYVKIFINPD